MVNINPDNPTSLGDIPENPQHGSSQDKHICNTAVRNLKYLDSSVITAGLMFTVNIKPPAKQNSKMLMKCNLIFDA